MSKPVAYSVLIRDGQKQHYEEVWVNPYRELIWGPEAFVEWLEAGGETEDEPEELSGIAIVDFDSQTLQWGQQEVESLPAVQLAQQKLLQQAWPGFEITYLSDDQMYKIARSMARPEGTSTERYDEDEDSDVPQVPRITIAGLESDDFEDRSAEDDDEEEEEEEPDDDDGPLTFRLPTVREAAGHYDNDEDGEDEDEEDNDDDDPDFPSAWVTIVDQHGKVRHRRIQEISKDLLTGIRTAVQDLAQLKAAEVPPEKSVTEGFWINVKDKQIGIWGGHATLACLDTLQNSWPKWNVVWAANGYRDQCTLSGVPGIPMTDTEVLVKFIPQVLSAKKMDFGEIFSAMGGGLKKTAMKATGCLVLVLSLPILIGGIFLGKPKEASFAILTLGIVVAVIFKVIEFRIKSKFKNAPFNQSLDIPSNRPPVAGPLDPQERQTELDRLLTGCGYPTVSNLQPHFPEDPF